MKKEPQENKKNSQKRQIGKKRYKVSGKYSANKKKLTDSQKVGQSLRGRRK
jgi:hypothetical protein